MKVFESLTEPLRLGYEVYAPVPEGYLVRTRVRDRWALALVDLRGARRDERQLSRRPAGL